MKNLFAFLMAILSTLIFHPDKVAAEQKPGELRLEPYSIVTRDSQKIEGELGHLTVPENRRNPKSRLIEISFVRLKSAAANPGPPIVYLEGGPGGSGIAAAKGPALPILMALRTAGDVILLDQRGTGMSGPNLICSEIWDFPLDRPGDPKEWMALAKEKLRACAEKFRKEGIDLSGYNTKESAEDIEDLRKALKIEKLNLWGISYGTYLALALIKRHPAEIERAVLTGTNGPDHMMMKLPTTIQSQIVKIDSIFKSDSSISRHVADFQGLLKTLLAQLEKKPVTVELTNPKTKEKAKLTLGKWDLQFHTAKAVTQTWSLMNLPSFFYAMSKGDFTPLAQRALEFRKASVGSMMAWMTLSSSGVSDERFRQIKEEAKADLLANAINFPFPEIREALGNPDLGSDFRTPVKSDVPVLFISGTLDGRTPVENAEEVRNGFRNGEHLVVDGASHGYDLFFFQPDVTRAMLEFLRGQPLSKARVTLSRFAFTPISP